MSQSFSVLPPSLQKKINYRLWTTLIRILPRANNDIICRLSYHIECTHLEHKNSDTLLLFNFLILFVLCSWILCTITIITVVVVDILFGNISVVNSNVSWR